MNTMDKHIFHNVVSAAHCKVLMEKGIPHYTQTWWLWNKTTNICTLRGYYYDIENLVEMGDNNVLELSPYIHKIPAYTINDIMNLLGDYTVLCRNGKYKIHNLFITVQGDRLADTMAAAVYEMIENGVMCNRTFQIFSG